MAKLIDLIVSGKSSFANDISAKNIYADNFIRNGSSNNYVLLGGGGHKALSDFSMSHSHPYLSYSSVYPTNTINLNDYFSTSTMYRVYYDYSGSSKIQNGPYESDAGAVINFPTYSGTQVYFNYYNNDVKVRTHYNGHITSWATFITSENIGSQSVNYSASAGNADTLDSFHSNRFTFVYNSTNYNNSSSLTVNQMAADGNSNSHVGMIYAGTDNPVSSSGNWVHVWSQSWSRGSISSWCSQIALGVQQGTGMWYRTTSGALAGKAWNRVLDSANYTSYVNNYYWANVKISTSSNSATYPTFANMKSTGRVYLDEWIQFSGSTGLYWPNANGAHLYANTTTSYAGLITQGSRGGYCGLQCGPGTTYMTVMSTDTHHGLFCENTGTWEFYYNRGNGGVGIRTSSITKNFNVSGQSYLSSNVWIGTTSGGEMLNVGGGIKTENYITFGTYGARFDSDIRNSWRTNIYGNTTNESRLKTVRTDANINNFSEIYGSGLTWATGDTQGYLGVSYSSGKAWIGGGSGNVLHWSTYLVTGNNIGSQSVSYASSSPATANYGGQGETTKIKIKINSATSWMLSFVVTIYQGYKSSKVMVSGYNYGSNYWYNPEAVLLGDSDGATSIPVYFGYDSAYNLWVGFDGGSYTGVSVSDVTNGYTQISSYKDLFTISNVSSLSTLQTTVTAVNSVNYAVSAGNAHTVDSLHASAFMRAASDGSYYGIQHPDGGTSSWTRTTANGIIPYTSGGASNLGTSSWPFSTVYANNFYGYLNGNISGNAATVTVNSSDANSTYRMVWHSGNTLYGTGGIYCNPSTDYVYANSFNCGDWFRSTGTSGWYNPTNNCHVYPNSTTSYGGLMLRGEKGGYTGFILGSNSNYMNLMDNGTDKGLYQEGKLWILYYNRSNNYVGIRTSSLSYPLTISGDSYTNGWSRAASGFYCESTGVYFTHQASVGEIDMTSNNEFLWGSSTSALYFNYRGVSRGTTVTNYIWNAGSSTSWASHNMGNIWLNGSGVYLRLGPQNSSHAHYETNAATSHWFNKRVDVNGAIWRYNTNYGISSDGYFYAKGVYANRDGASTYGGVSLYSTSDPITEYGIAFRGTGNYGKIGRVQGDWATYFTMDSSHNRGWIFRSGGTNYASVSARGEAYFSAVGTNNYIAYPSGGFFSSDGSKSGYIIITIPANYKSCTMMRFNVEIYNYSTGTSTTYTMGGYNYDDGNWYNVFAYANRQGTTGYGNLTVRFGHNGTNSIIWIGESNTSYSYPKVRITNVTLGHSTADYNTWATGWSVTIATTAPTNVSQVVINPATNYYAESAGNADTVDGQHFNWNNNKNDHTYLWAASSNGQAYLVHRASMSVNYANSAGSASTVTVNSSDANSTYRMVWHSGNTLYGTGGIYCNPSSDYLYATSVQTSDWFRSTGNSGWYSQTYGGGWYMNDTTYIRVYNSKRVYNDNTSQYAFYTAGGMTVLGHMYSNSSACSWIAGQNATNAALNIGDATDTGSYWPWFRQTNTSSKKWFSVGTLNNSLYFIGSATSRTANSYDYGFRMDFSNGYLYGNFSGYLSGRAAEVTVNNSDSNSTYRMVWHSGNTLYSTAGIYCNPSTDALYASAFYETSDIRFKKNVKQLFTSNNIPQIKEFDWKNTGKHSYGLIAQELESMGYSELVDTKDDGYKSVNYTAALCLIIGKLQLKIKELEDKIKSS